MNTAGIIMIGMALGISSVFAYAYAKQAISERLNNGQKVRFEGEVIGHVVVCRYNGVKKYFFTTKSYGPLNRASSVLQYTVTLSHRFQERKFLVSLLAGYSSQKESRDWII